MGFVEKRIAAELRRGGYKLTPQRRVVLNVLAHSQEHLSPAEVYERVHQEDPSIGLVTVYRTLEILTELGLICAVHAGDSCGSYVIGPQEHHDHLICSDCGTVLAFADCNLDGLEQRLSTETGFKIDSHLLEFLGRCQDCQKDCQKEERA